ncbi:LysR family transcriptional regulator [Amycolatopsis endophytica]|uniref:DNA-binding transcriptional LysR family regulator n=1 Tax=Amycolatopsis endophytica TaxID=860233 RepID=A0A853AWY8_9PSEU|nr:LysR family transcriptional regulator [Amycolatopsis endophytica]NYI87253.1 DNA-binding transcriptional LysR family regulator [Amycolatopsis endophytica]
MDRVETRELAYFVAVAEALHFGRAAEGLGLAQPALSKAVRSLERRLDVTLFERTSRRVELTPAGEVLLGEARRALSAVAAAARRTQRAGRGVPYLALAAKPGGDAGMLSRILGRYESDPEAVPVELVSCHDDRVSLLHDGRADVALLHTPFDDPAGLETAELRSEPRSALLPPDHPLARRSILQLSDLRGEPVGRWAGYPDDGGVEVTDLAKLLRVTARGRAVALLPRSVLDTLDHDLATVPVVDAAPARLLLAWPQGTRSPAIAALVRAAREAAGRADTPAHA